MLYSESARKTAVENIFFTAKFFPRKIGLWYLSGEFFKKQHFFGKTVFINIVFRAGSEYNIHFAVKQSENVHIDSL